MKMRAKYAVAAMAALAGSLAAGSVWAAVAAPTAVPEPGLFGIVAAASAAVVVAARLRRK